MPCLRKGLDGIFRPLLICLIFFLGFSVWGPVVMAQDSDPVKKITIAVGQDYAPFYFKDQKGVADGWLVDIWRLWAKKTGIRVAFVPVPFGETLKLTREGKVDVQGGCFYSKKRAAYLDYVAPLAKCDTNFFFHKNIYGIETLKDLLSYRIGVIKGDFAVGYLNKHLPGASLVQYATNDALFEALQKDQLRVFVMDTPIGLFLLDKWKLRSSFNYYPGRPVYSNAYRAAVRKGNTVLASVVQKGLGKITPEEKAAMERRWVGATRTRAEGVLTIACDRFFPPFTMLTPSGRASGILIDLWRLWSRKNIRKIEFIFGDWEDSLRMVKEGTADIHSGLYKTKGREKVFSFSAPIFAAQNHLAFRKRDKGLTLEDLEDEKVGVIAGSGQETELRENYPKILIAEYSGYRDLIYALRDGEILAAYDVGVSLQRVIEELGLQGEIEVSKRATPFRDLCAGVLKKNAATLRAINHGFSEITDREMKDIEARWVSNPDLRLFSGKARALMLTPEEKAWLKAHPQIRLGIDPGFMPFEAFSSEDVYEGISSSYVSIINEKLGVNMAPVTGLNWQQVMDAAETHEVDVLPCVAMTKKRSEFLQFTRSYLDFEVVAAARKDAPLIAGLDGLKGSRVAVVEGYYVQELLGKDYPEIRLVPVGNIEKGLEAVQNGDAAAYVDNSASIIYNIRKLGLTDLKIVATTPYRPGLRFGVRKDWPQLATILEKALQSISEEERNKIANRWVNVIFARHTDWALLIKIGIAAVVVLGLILSVILLWNRRLSREVGERKRAEERFEAIAGTTPGAIIQLRFNDEGIPECLYLSAKAEDFFRMPPEQVIKEKERLRWHPEDRQRIHEEIATLTAAGEDLNLVGRIQPEGEETLWVRINASPSGSSEGNPIYSGFILDITERKLAEQEYLRSERKIKAMSQAAEDAMVMIDGEGKVLFWNPAAERLFGYNQEEAMGMDFHQMATPQVYHDKIYKGLKHFAHTGEGPVLGTTTEITARNREGHEFPVEVTLSSFQVDEEWFAVGTVRDITERKEAEEALRKSEKRLNTILETANDGFFAVNNNQEVIEANPAMCKILGRELEDVTGKTTFDFVDEEHKTILLEQIERRKRGEKGSYEIALSRPDGNHVFCLFNVSPYFDENNEKLGAFAMVTDISERKRAEDRLKFTQTTVDKAALTIFWVDPQTGMFIYANDAACNSLGYTREELLNMHVPQIDLEFNEEKFAGLMGMLKTRSHVETEGIHLTKDGRNLNVFLSIVLTQLEDRQIIAVFARDETEKKQAEKALKESEQRVQTILNAINTGVIIIDPENRTIVDVNPVAAQMIGLPGKEIMGRTCHRFICPKEMNDCPVLDGDQAIENAEKVLITAEGREIPILKTVTRVNLGGKIHLMENFIDISELKEVEEAMRQGQKELKDRLEELEQFNRLVVGREIKMIALKEEVNGLLEKLGQEEKYEIVNDDTIGTQRLEVTHERKN